MKCRKPPNYSAIVSILSSLLILGALEADSVVPPAQPDGITLATGFLPDPLILAGTGGGQFTAETIVNTRQTPTGLCLGHISSDPHEEMMLANYFSNLEVSVNSKRDTTLIIEGPGGIWCNDDTYAHNPAIVGEWLPGNYRIWIGAYQLEEIPRYELLIHDLSL